MTQPILFQRIESAAIFIACLYFYYHLGFNLIWFIVLLFAVDIFMLGYTVNNKVGAYCYNFGHSYIVPVILFVLGVATFNNILIAGALIWGAHIGFDRSLGYGLKFESGFKDTHLGKIGKKSK